MRLKPGSLAAGALTLAVSAPVLAQDGMDRGWGDMGRSSDYYDFRDPGRDRYYDRYSDDLRDRGDRRYPQYERDARMRSRDDGNRMSNWYDERRDWFTADRSDGDYADRGWGDMGRSSEYYDFRDPGPDRRYDRYRDDLSDRRWREDRYRYGDEWQWRNQQRSGMAGGPRYRSPDYYERGDYDRYYSDRRQDRDWRDYEGTAESEYDWNELRDQAQWGERTYRGTANRGLRGGMQ